MFKMLEVVEAIVPVVAVVVAVAVVAVVAVANVVAVNPSTTAIRTAGINSSAVFSLTFIRRKIIKLIPKTQPT